MQVGLWVLHDQERNRCVLYDSTSERPLPCEAFVGWDCYDQAKDFLDWFDGLKLNVRDVRGLSPADLDRFLAIWHDQAFNDADEFVGVEQKRRQNGGDGPWQAACLKG